MNHIYKSIFNKALGVFTAVPEFASAHGKGSERTVVGRVAKGTAGFAASALAISIGLALSSNAMANVDTDVASGVLRIADPTGTNSIRMGSGTTLDDANKQWNSISVGVDAGVNTASSVAIGYGAKAGKTDKFLGQGAVALGYNAQALGTSNISIGEASSATNGHNGVAIGAYSKTENEKTISIGAFSTASGAQSTVISSNYDTNSTGPVSVASGRRSQIYGAETTVSGEQSVSIGDTNTIASARTYALGNNINVKAGADDSLVFGTQANVGAVHSIAMGTTAAATGISSIALGKSAKATDQRTIAMGENALAGNEASMALGYNSSAKGSKQVSIGLGAGALKNATDAGAELATFVGHYAGADNASLTGNAQGVAVGVNAGRFGVAGIRNVAVGSNTGQTVNGNDNTSIGYNSGRSVEGSGNLSGGLNSGVFLKGNNNVALGSNAGNGTAAQALEVNSTTSIGNDAKALTNDSVAIGTGAKSGKVDRFSGERSVAIGAKAEALGTGGIAIGDNAATTDGHNSVAIGVYSKTQNEKAISIGAFNKATGAQSIVIAGNYDTKNSDGVSTATAARATVIGAETNVSGEQSVAIGDKNTIASARTYVMGNNINAAAGTNDSLAFGTKAGVGGANAIALGNTAKATKENTIAQGTESVVYGKNSVSIGYKAVSGIETPTPTQTNAFSVSIGNETEAIDASTIAIGDKAKAKGGVDALAVGTQANAMTYKALAIGAYSQATGRQSTVIGNDIQGQPSIASGTRSQILGVQSNVSGDNSVSIGDTNTVASARTYALGNNINAAAGTDDSLAFGTRAHVSGANQVSIGTDAGADNTSAGEGNTAGISIGNDAGRYATAGKNNTSIGQRAGQYANGDNNVAIGKDAGSLDAAGAPLTTNTVSIGSSSKVKGQEAIAVGNEAEAISNSAIAIGNSAKGRALYSTAIGLRAKTSDDATMTFGESATAVGHAAAATRYSAAAFGHDSFADGESSVALGYAAKALGTEQIAIGAHAGQNRQGTQTGANFSVAIGRSAGGDAASALGNHSGVSVGLDAGRYLQDGSRNTAVGGYAGQYVKGSYNVALGHGAGSGTATEHLEASETISIGHNSKASAAYSTAIGTNANAAQANSVALGAGSTTSDVHTGDYTLNGSYTAAGLPKVANGTVSVGAVGKERQIQNVAAGVISATSTDAINGSQLYATNNYLSNLAGGVKNVLGGDAAVDNAGNVTMSNIGGTGKGNVNDAIAAANTKVAAGENITVTPTDNADGSKTYTVATKKDLVVDSVKAGDTTVNTNGVTIANGPSVTKTGINAGDKKITGVANGNVAAGSTDAVNGGQLAEVKAKADSAVQNVVSANPTALTATKAGDTVTLTPNVIAGDLVNPATGAVNTPAAGDAGKLVTAGTVANALANTHFVVDTAKTDGELDAASKHDQKIKSGNKVTLQAGKNLKAKQTNAADGATVEFSLKDSISLTQVTAGTGDNQVVLGNNGVQVGGNTYINNDGLNANNKPISNVADGVKPKDAVNKGQLDAVAQEAAKHTTVKAGKNVEVTESNNAAGGKEYTVKTADNLNVTSVKAGDSTLNTDGLTITGGPSVKKDGINAGDKKITGVADGNVAAGSKDAVNGGQLAEVKAKADSAVQNVVSSNPTALTATKAGDTVTLTPNFIAGDLVNADGTVKDPAAADEGKLVSAKTVADALKANHFVVDTKANGGTVDAASEENAKVGSGNKVTFEAGKNLVAQQTNTANGGATVNYKLSDTLENLVSVKSAEIEAGIGPNKVVLNNNGVKVGDSTLNDKGLTINNGPSVTDAGINAGNKKITDVAPGAVTPTSKDAVNGSQLYNVADNVKDLIGPDATIDPATGKVTVADPTQGIAGTGKGTIGEAIKSVKDKADTAVQDIKSGDEKALSVTKAGNTYTITPNLSGDLVDANGNITAPTTPADKGKLVTAGTVAEALANTHFVVDTKATDGELDAASQADQKIKASNKVTLQAGKNLKAKQTNGANGAEVEFSLKDSISLKEVKVGEGSANEVVLNNNGVNVAGSTYINKDGLNANGNKVANVKAGDVSATSTDAVNGAQLHNVATSVANVLGGNAAVDGNGNVTSSDIGGTGANTVDDAIKAVNATAAKHTTVVEGKNVKVTKGKNAAGGDEYTVATKDDLDVTSVTAGNTTVNTNGLTITGGPSVTRGGIDAGDRVISGVKAGDVSANSKEAVNGSQLHATNTKLDGVKAKADTAVQDVKSGDENALTAVKDPNTNIVTVTPKLSGDLVDANGNITAPATPADKGKLVTAGTVADALANTHFVVDTKATDGELDGASQADQKIKAGNKVTLQAGKNLKAKQTNGANGAQVEFSLKDSISLKEVTAGEGANQVVLGNDGVKVGGNTYINNDGLNANNKPISNVADGVKPTDAVNKGQLDAVKGVADSAVKSVDVANGEQNLVVDNSDPKNPKLSLKKDLTVDSVKAGDSTLNTDGLTIAGGPSVKKDGINAGDKTITNVAPGAVTPTSKDAVNGGQLYNVANNVKDLIGPDATIDPATGKVTVADPAKGIGETGKGNIGDAIKHVNDAAKAAADTAKKHTTVEQGDNILVEESLNADGGKHYKVSTARDLNVDSVKAGDTTVNNDGVTIAGGPSVTKGGINAGGNTITNVADGVNPDDAVNKGQLDKVDTKVSNVAQNVVNVLGGDATVNGNGDITMSNIGETGKGNINDAIKSVNDLAKKAAAEKTSVKAKEGRSNVTVTEGVNAAGGHEYTVDVERSVTNAGSDYVTVTNNHDADSNTTTYTVDVSAKTKASLAKADSAVQGLTSKDGNLNFTKGANGNVEVSFNDNLNVKNVTTDRVQVANGPSMSKDGINAAGKAISNVANGNVAADSKDAVNGGQLHETAKSVADVIGGGATVKDGKVVAGQNGIGNTGQNTVHGAIAAINQNTANNFNQIRGDLRKMDRDLRGGIAGALATAGLPQAFRPGKSMVAAAASTYRGQSGLAIGVSRISDNGKIILKVTGNTNSRGDFGGTIGAGYQW